MHKYVECKFSATFAHEKCALCYFCLLAQVTPVVPPRGVQLTLAGGSMTCFWKPPPGAPPAKYRVWINNNAETYLLGEQDSSQLFVFIPSKDLQSDTPYSCLVEACSELDECSPRTQSPIVRSDKRRKPSKS